MSEAMGNWTPKVGDRVMVGEHAIYAGSRVGSLVALYRNPGPVFAAEDYLGAVPLDWLTPAPEPEPESAGEVLARLGTDAVKWAEEFLSTERKQESYIDEAALIGWFANAIGAGEMKHSAEVEQLRRALLHAENERDAYRRAKQENDERFQLEAAAQRERADELQRRIDDALALIPGASDTWPGLFLKQGRILRGGW